MMRIKIDCRAWSACFLLVSAFSFSLPAVADSIAFLKALKSKDMQTVSVLIGRVDDVDKPLDDGRTALMLASKLGMNSMVVDLLEAGANVNARNNNGGTSLMYSAIHGDADTVDVLLTKGAQVNLTAKFGWTALMIAAAKGHGVIVEKLIAYGADVNSRDVYHWTPLIRASHAGYAQAVKALLNEPETDINALDETSASALHHAATNEHVEVVGLLLEYCASKNLQDNFDMTALDRAETTHNSLTIELLQNPFYQSECK